MERAIEPFRQIPPSEDLDTSFILEGLLGNGSSENPIYIVVSTHGLLQNAIEQGRYFPTFQQTDTTYKITNDDVLKLGYTLTHALNHVRRPIAFLLQSDEK